MVRFFVIYMDFVYNIEEYNLENYAYHNHRYIRVSRNYRFRSTTKRYPRGNSRKYVSINLEQYQLRRGALHDEW